MKIKLILAVGLLMSAFISIDAHAGGFCGLAVSPSSYISRGQDYSYILDTYDFGPLPPLTFTVKFFGTKNGFPDIPATGETYPGTFGFGRYYLTGYQNPPWGGLTGAYTRYAVIYDQYGQVWCTTNTIDVTLQ